MLILVSILNAFFVLTRTKKYSLAGRPIENVPDTPSRRKEIYEEVVEYEDDSGVASTAASMTESVQSPAQKMWSFLSGTPTVADPPAAQPEQTEIWVLDVWNPPLFNLYLFAVFSPLSVIIVWYGPVCFFNFGVLLPLLNCGLYDYTTRFLVGQKDKTIVHSEVIAEYDAAVVRPIISAARRDVSIGADGSVAWYDAGLNHRFKAQRAPTMQLRRAAASNSSFTNSMYGSSLSSPAPDAHLGSPVFPASLGAANVQRQRHALPQYKLQYNSAGYYTGTPIRNEEVGVGVGRGDENSPLSRKSGLLRRLRK